METSANATDNPTASTVRRMRSEATTHETPIPGWVLILLLAPLALLLGFAAGDSFLFIGLAVLAIASIVGFSAIRLSLAVKLIFLLIVITFLQRLLGYFKLGEARGVNVLNLLLVSTIGYWLLGGLRRGTFYRPSPIDFWLCITVVVIPVVSLTYTVAFGRVPGYDLTSQLAWYKRYITPFIYLFLLSQCLESKRDIRYLYYLIFAIVALVVLQGMPEVVHFSNWRESRSEGIVGQANDYAALLATTAPLFFLWVLLFPGHRAMKTVVIVLLGCMAISMLTTFSRAGYIGFAMAFGGAVFIAYKVTRRLTVLGPVILFSTLCLLPIVAMPQIVDSLATRFQPETYKRSHRKSYSKFEGINQYSGGRLELWKSALRMAEDYPVLGVGFHAFELVLPRYHYLQWSNYCHNQFLATLAEGGIIWLTALCALYWKLYRLLYQNWRTVFSQGDRTGILICGGALLSYLIMLFLSLTSDFNNPGPKSLVFWITIAGALRYGLLARLDEQGESDEASDTEEAEEIGYAEGSAPATGGR